MILQPQQYSPAKMSQPLGQDVQTDQGIIQKALEMDKKLNGEETLARMETNYGIGRERFLKILEENDMTLNGLLKLRKKLPRVTEGRKPWEISTPTSTRR